MAGRRDHLAARAEALRAGRAKLPVFDFKDEFLSAVREHQVIVCVGQTGSGGSTGDSVSRAL